MCLDAGTPVEVFLFEMVRGPPVVGDGETRVTNRVVKAERLYSRKRLKGC